MHGDTEVRLKIDNELSKYRIIYGYQLSDDKKFSKILVTIDGSQHSMKAARYAISFAIKYNSELILLYVIPADLGSFGYPRRALKKWKGKAKYF